MTHVIVVETEAEKQARDDARDRLLICMSDCIRFQIENDPHITKFYRHHLMKLLQGFQIDLLRTSKQLYGEPRSYFVDEAGNPVKREDRA